MKQFLKFALFLSLISLEPLKKTYGSTVGFVGASVGWTNIIQSVNSRFESDALISSDFADSIKSQGQTVLDTPNPDNVKSAQPENQRFMTQNLDQITSVYPSSRPSGEIFIGGEYRENGLIFQAQIGLNFISGQAQQRFTYHLTKQSMVDHIIDANVNSEGSSPKRNPNGGLENPLIQNFNYNGIDSAVGNFEIKTNIGFKALFGMGYQQNDLAIVLNFGYAGEHNIGRLSYYEDSLALGYDENDQWEDNTSIKKLWRHGFLLGLQLIWSLSSSFDALIFWQKTFYMNKTFDFTSDFAENPNDKDSSKIYSREFLYNFGTLPTGNHNAENQDKTGSVNSPINSNGTTKFDSHIESTYIGFGLRFKMGGED